jgi:hypothetical protein
VSSKFTVGLRWGERDHALVVTGTKQPEVPETRATWKDPGSPAEGGEIEDISVSLVYHGKERALCGKIVRRLEADERFIERVDEALRSEK